MKLTQLIKVLSIAFICCASLFLVNPVSALDCSDTSIPNAVREAAGCTGSSKNLPDAIVIILNSIIFVSGLVAVIFVIIGGINYMTSSGDAGKVKKAKDTILYAVIGLIVCVLAFAIINFVIANILHQ